MFVCFIIFEGCIIIIMFITFVYCLFIYFRATHIKFHILSSWINAPWNSLRPDWILGFGHKSLVQWEKNTHKHTYIEHIARLRTKKDEMEKKMSKNKKTKRWHEFIHFCIPSARKMYLLIYSKDDDHTHSYVGSKNTTYIHIFEARKPCLFISV
jgi:hypothetical protein